MSPATVSPSSTSALSTETNPAEPLYQVKLLAALRSGDPALIHPFLTEIGKDRRKSAEGEVDVGAAALHLAIRCASVDTVALLLSHRAISPNGIYADTTPLHLAASLGRVDVVNLLLEQERIDDTLKDSRGRTCKEVAKGKDVLRAIADSRALLNASYQSHLRTYIHSPPTAPPNPAFLALLDSPRVRFVNLSYLDDATGSSLLHEAAKRKDLRLIELAVRAGADVFVRDRRGKMAYDGVPKDDRVRVFLRQFANHDTTLIDAPISEPPALKGYLNKYVNVARGHQTRWFVLKGGVLSYYRHQEDETVASRGSISMKTAVLKVAPGGEKLRFEVHSVPSRGHQSVQKWYMKANHHVEAHRWTQAIGKSIDWYKREREEEHARMSGDSDASGLKPASLFRSGSSAVSRRSAVSQRSTGSTHAEDTGGETDGDASPVMNHPGDGSHEDDAEDKNDESSDAESTHRAPPHDSTFELQGNSTTAQVELTAQLLSDLALPANASPRAHEVKSAIKDSLATVQGMLHDYMVMSKAREEWWKSTLRQERQRQALWEESLRTVVKEGEVLEQELRDRSRRRGSRFLAASESGMGTLKQRPPNLPLSSADVREFGAREPQSYFPAVQASASPAATPQPMSSLPTPRPAPTTAASYESETGLDTDDEDEFFDAIESNNLPNLVVNESLASPVHSQLALPEEFNLEPFVAYKNLRSHLAISSDDRPSTSLWSVLKHSIGKDLTKISFPVFFNEPTSMLQRMAEDMEFSECLDAAARESDPLKRIAFVAAFAMSNYSSTIGRIAKPFNPMLGETFEYVRHDKEYRYVSEQVSHHPPISACWADSPLWYYYGEVDAQNKFMGKSFEIAPKGIAHCELLLPEESAAHDGYPKATGKLHEGKVVEHYSWKKVTTNVSGFILGSPTIDHYGDMVITNHRTNDTCVLTFKPRGWRGRDAYEISGFVKDSSGRVAYEIAGRWNSQLVAREAGAGSGFLHPDVAVSGPSSPSATREYILLWRNSEKPPAPFNLTPFAVTLNDCPTDTLKPYVCPTDCRLRPDQRAFELGKYELANELKNAQEEKQRATRRAREEGRLPDHRPRWFSAVTDGDTGERLWAPARTEKGDLEYWAERTRVFVEGGVEKSEWKEVDPIFVEEPGELKALIGSS
ncbi:hypothetical protein PLICRDRAFT_702189 [Plicaturopsis crispa FD-325 SS-3]|uniref:PH domain-containing protein n=1 Tax=Plicaturopsis crispa FD-325 SS-3 TaxID=944288 RepID=A0A0C9SWT2_PLICR|nr:hypothetical protein PLICRDRAFT_702189 [Plicaturopsis crispa FD-325 SS-3]